MLALNTGT